MDKGILMQMKDEELQKEIQNINNEIRSNISYLAFFEVFKEYILLKNNIEKYLKKIDKLDTEGNEILSLYEKIENSMKNINVVLATDNLNNNFGTDYFRKIRNEIVELLMAMSPYITEISYTNEILNDIIMRENFKKFNFNRQYNIDLEKFYEDVYNFLRKDMNHLFDKISKIISVIPLRISKQFYYELVKKAMVRDLKRFSKTKVDLIIKRYKSIFNGALAHEYGKKFDMYFRLAQESRLFDYKNNSLEEIQDYNRKSIMRVNEMYDIINFLRNCGIILNRLIVISRCKDYFTDNKYNFEIRTIVDKWNIFQDKKSNTNQKEILDICQRKIKDIEIKINKNNSHFETLMNIYTEKKYDLSDDTNKLLADTQNLFAYINDFYIEKEELLLNYNDDIVEYDYLVQAVDNFIQFINRAIKEMPNPQRKVRMRRILTVIPAVFTTPQDFFKYLKNSLELSTSKEDMLYDINKIDVIMREYNRV